MSQGFQMRYCLMCEHKQLCNILAQIIYSVKFRAATLSYFHLKIKMEIKILTGLLISYGQNMCQNILNCGSCFLKMT